MRKRNCGFAFIEVIFVILIIIVTLLLFPKLHTKNVKYGCYGNGCYNKLREIRNSLTTYQLDLGRQVFYPNRDGQGFLLALYKEKILLEPEAYLCPETTDTNSNGADFWDALDLGDEKGPVSYAGRKNANQSIYPGLFHLSEDTSTTPLACDDMTPASRDWRTYDNHKEGRHNILFLDGHVDKLDITTNIFDNNIFFKTASNFNFDETIILDPMAN